MIKLKYKPKPQPIKIEPYQQDHFKRILNILQHEYGYLDVSAFGSGKTHISFAVAAFYKLKMIIICPKSTISNWKNWGIKYGINILNIMSYQSLRGMKGKDLNHDLLQRSEDSFSATEIFENNVKKGVLVVFDECQMVKNENSQLHSAHELVKTVIRIVKSGHETGSKSRISILSATPSVTKEQVTSVCKMLGVIRSEKLYKYNRSNKTYDLLGLQEAIDKCNNYDPDVTFHATCRPINKTTVKTICHELYKRILKKHLVSSMPSPPINAEKDAKNLYAIFPEEDIERMKKGIMLFSSATNYRHQIEEVSYKNINWGDVTRSRMEVDSAKVNTVCRLAKQDLEKNPNCKVIIYFTYTRDIEKVCDILKPFNPLKLYGKTNNRDDVMTKFQADNNEYRVLVSNPKVGGVGIDLDDVIGNRPRIMYIAPSYFFIDQYQATGRIYRKDTKSKAIIRFVYCREFPYETGILNSMANKSCVAKDMILDKTNILFPGEYDEEIELYENEKE